MKTLFINTFLGFVVSGSIIAQETTKMTHLTGFVNVQQSEQPTSLTHVNPVRTERNQHADEAVRSSALDSERAVLSPSKGSRRAQGTSRPGRLITVRSHPKRTVLSLRPTQPIGGSATIRLIDQSGQTVLCKTRKAKKGAIRLDLTGLPNAAYTVQFDTAQSTKTVDLMKLE